MRGEKKMRTIIQIFTLFLFLWLTINQGFNYLQENNLIHNKAVSLSILKNILHEGIPYLKKGQAVNFSPNTLLFLTELPVATSKKMQLTGSENNLTNNLTKLEPLISESSFPTELTIPSQVTKTEEVKSTQALTTNGREVVFIYHTHNRESFLPELKNVKSANNAYDEEINITLVGKKIGEELDNLGIANEVSAKDYWNMVSYPLSYTKSKEAVKEVLARNKDVTFIFDIHRDSQRRELTTQTIDGVTYSKVYLIIGKSNKNHAKNLAFAKKINDKLNEKSPGLSRGINFVETREGTNGEFNQSLFPNSVLIEIGGVENTLEEEYRTAKILAEVIAELYWDAEQVSGN